MLSRYQFKNKLYRETIDLTKYEAILIKAIYTVIDDTIKVRVTTHYFEIYTNIDNALARKIGRRISFYCPEIRNFRKTYISKNGSTSRQIFVRVR